MLNFLRKCKASSAPDSALSAAHLALLERLFGAEEGKKHLLNVVAPVSPDAETVLKDAAAVELTVHGAGYRLLERAVWYRLLTALRKSLASTSLSEREAARQQVLAYLAVLHLPYEMRYAADAIKQANELAKAQS